jgi:uncharacterized protein YraI
MVLATKSTNMTTVGLDSRESVGSAAGGLGAVMDRRGLLKLVGRAGAAAVAGGVLLASVNRAGAASGWYRTTSRLNLRSGPGTGYGVRLVLPEGALVSSQGETSGAWLKVAYDGTIGWAHGDYLAESNGGSNDEWPVVGSAVTTSAVNLRSGPSTGHKVLRVLARGTRVEITDNLGNGFRAVVHDGLAGWVYDDYLDGRGNGPRPGAYLTTTTALNFRAEPSMTAKVLAVMPTGTVVTRSDQAANGFAYVAYNGNWGWAWMDYLR